MCDPERRRWYLDASWSTPATPLPTPAELAATGTRLLAVDLNAGHLAACVIDAHGNPVGQPITIPTDLTGPTSQRDGRLRQAISELIHLAKLHGCTGLAIENLGFTDARATGRETMGRGTRGRTFRRTVAGLPTAKFRDRLSGMAHHAGLIVVAVDPPTPAVGAPNTGRLRSNSNRRPPPPATMRRRWRSAGAPSDTEHGVGQV